MWAAESRIIIFMLETHWFSGKRGCALALIFLTLFAAGQGPAGAAPRSDVEINSDWKCQEGDGDGYSRNAVAAAVDKAVWQAVSLPHCWGWEDAQAGKQYDRG